MSDKAQVIKLDDKHTIVIGNENRVRDKNTLIKATPYGIELCTLSDDDPIVAVAHRITQLEDELKAKTEALKTAVAETKQNPIQTYEVEVSWFMTRTIEVEARSVEEAAEEAHKWNEYRGSSGEEMGGEYVLDTFKIDMIDGKIEFI